MVVGGLSWGAGGAIGALAAALLAALAFIYNVRRAGRADARGRSQEARETRDVAREEALDLAEVRGKAISDLHTEVGQLRTEVRQERDSHLAAIAELQAALDLSREQALETLQMLAHGMRGLLVWILGELEHEPPRVDVVARRIREALADTDPHPPGQRRRAA